MENRVLIALLHFQGHPVLGDDQMNNLRYDYLQSLLFGPFTNHRKVMIISNHKSSDERLTEISHMAAADGHIWVRIDPEEGDLITVDYIENIAMKHNVNISSVYIGGTNTAGCVLHSKKWSAIEWAKSGYSTTILLQLCGEYQMSGTSYQRSLCAFSFMYEKIINEKMHDRIKIRY